MTAEKISLSAQIPAKAQTIYQDWLNSQGHSAITGGAATITAELGSDFTAWNGYISGTITDLEAYDFIRHTWRTTEFPKEAEDSIVEVLFEALDAETTLVTINHSNIPDGDGVKYKEGWQVHYLEPMLSYYTPSLTKLG